MSYTNKPYNEGLRQDSEIESQSHLLFVKCPPSLLRHRWGAEVLERVVKVIPPLQNMHVVMFKLNDIRFVGLISLESYT